MSLHDRLKALFVRAESGEIRCVGFFEDYSSEVRFAISHADGLVADRATESERRRVINMALGRAHHDLWACFGLIARLAWMNEAVISGNLHEGLYFPWATLDIENFHVQLRSTYDYAAAAIDAAVGVKTKSFRRMQANVAGAKNRTRYSSKLDAVIRSADGFTIMRSVRDGIIHEGAHLMTLGTLTEGIRFQVYDAGQNAVELEGLMQGRTLIFHRYAVQALGSTLLFFEDLAHALYEQLPTHAFGAKLSWSYAPGYDVFLEWLTAAPDLPREWRRPNQR